MTALSDMMIFLRKRSRLSQQELADKLGLKRSAISMYETGKREPDLETLEIFADFYNVDMNTLTGRTASMTNKEIFALNLQKYMNENHKTRTDLADALGISYYTVTDWVKGKKYPRMDKVEQIAKYFGVKKSDLIEKTEPIPTGFIPLPETEKVPLLGKIACGQPILAEQNVEDYVDVPKDRKVDFCLLCSGDSMIDAGIHDGDLVYIRQQPDVENGEIAAVRIGSEATLKRVYKQDGYISLNAENKKYPPFIFREGDSDDITIVGKAVGFQHWY